MKEIKLNIPEGCKAVTVKVDGGKVITEFEPKEEKYEPKDGDYVSYLDANSGERWIGIFRKPVCRDISVIYIAILTSKDGKKINVILSQENSKSLTPDLRPATDEEIRILNENMKEISLSWNPITKEVEDAPGKRLRFSIKNEYYYVGDDLKTHKASDDYLDEDNARHGSFNYFRSYLAAERVAKQVREIFKNSKA